MLVVAGVVQTLVLYEVVVQVVEPTAGALEVHHQAQVIQVAAVVELVLIQVITRAVQAVLEL